MKAIKVILVIVTVIVILFFSTGLIIKETSYQVQIEIDIPLSEVFSEFNNQDAIKKWVPQLKSIEPVIVKPGVVGSEYNKTYANGEETIVLNEKVMAFIPNKKVTLFLEIDEMLKKDDFTFSTLNGKTLIVNNVICKSDSYIASCVFPYFKGMFTSADQEHLDKFKAYIEKQ